MQHSAVGVKDLNKEEWCDGCEGLVDLISYRDAPASKAVNPSKKVFEFFTYYV